MCTGVVLDAKRHDARASRAVLQRGVSTGVPREASEHRVGPARHGTSEGVVRRGRSVLEPEPTRNRRARTGRRAARDARERLAALVDAGRPSDRPFARVQHTVRPHGRAAVLPVVTGTAIRAEPDTLLPRRAVPDGTRRARGSEPGDLRSLGGRVRAVCGYGENIWSDCGVRSGATRRRGALAQPLHLPAGNCGHVHSARRVCVRAAIPTEHRPLQFQDGPGRMWRVLRDRRVSGRV